MTLNKKGLRRPYLRSPAEVRKHILHSMLNWLPCYQQVQKQYEANVAAKQISTKAKMPF